MTENRIDEILWSGPDLGRADLSDLADRKDDEIPLAETALRIAIAEYPNLDTSSWLSAIDNFADRARRLSPSDEDGALLDALDSVLFDEVGFAGDTSLYYDPRNSFLNEVIDRRIGIPISLSVLYIETGARLGLDLRGIGFPGHFLVGAYQGDRIDIIDPFNRGLRLAKDDCRRMLLAAGRSADDLDNGALEPISHRQIIVRMLTNLKLIYLRQNDMRRTVQVLTRLLQVDPTSVHELRDRGLVYLQSGNSGLALRDLEAYLKFTDDPNDAETVRAAIRNAKQSIAHYN